MGAAEKILHCGRERPPSYRDWIAVSGEVERRLPCEQQRALDLQPPAITAEPAVAAPGPGKTAPFGFTGIDPVNAGTDEVVVPEGFRWAPIIAWGDPVLAGAPAFDFDRQTAAAQAGQMGYNCDYVGVLRNGSANQAVLVVNN